MFRIFAEMLISCKQGLVELSSIWLHFSVCCFDMCSLASGLTPGVPQFCKMKQNNCCPPNRLNPGMNLLTSGSSLKVMDNDTEGVENSLNYTNFCLKRSHFQTFYFKYKKSTSKSNVSALLS